MCVCVASPWKWRTLNLWNENSSSSNSSSEEDEDVEDDEAAEEPGAIPFSCTNKTGSFSKLIVDNS